MKYKFPIILRRSTKEINILVDKTTDEKYDYIDYMEQTGYQTDQTIAIEMFYTQKISELEDRINKLENNKL